MQIKINILAMCNTKKTVISAEKCYFNVQDSSKSILDLLLFLMKMFLKPQISTKNVKLLLNEKLYFRVCRTLQHVLFSIIFIRVKNSAKKCVGFFFYYCEQLKHFFYISSTVSLLKITD